MPIDKDPADELAVRRLIADYTDAVWRMDEAVWSETWAEDAHWAIVGCNFVGREAIVGFWRDFMRDYRSAWQIQHGAILDIGKERGEGRIYVYEILATLQDSLQLSMGIYHDDFVKRDGRWYFARRHFDLAYTGALEASGTFFPVMPYGPGPTDPDRTRPATPSMAQISGGS